MRMVLAGVCALALAACGAGGGSKAAAINKCVEGGESKQTCTCMVTEMEKALDKDVYRAMLLQAEGKEEEANKIMTALPMDKQFSAATGMISVMAKCAKDK